MSPTDFSSGCYPNWKDLMPDVLSVILKFLPLADNIRFSAVCRSWCSAVAENLHPPGPQPPFLLLPGDSTGTSEFFQFFDLSDRRFYKIRLPQLRSRRCLGSSQGKLIYIDERAELHVLDPITGSEFDLPSITTCNGIGDPQFDENGNISGYFYDIVGHRQRLEPHPIPFPPPEFYPFRRLGDTYYIKVIICPKTSAIVAICEMKSKIAICLPGHKSWTMIKPLDPNANFTTGGFKDIVFYKDVLYGLSSHGELLSISFGDDLEVTKYEVLVRFYGADWEENYSYKYLVEADGELLLVWRRAYRVAESDADVNFTGRKFLDIRVTDEFKVFRMNWDGKQWEEMKSLGEYALFLGLNNSFSLCARDFPELKANNIYFTDDNNVGHALAPRLKRDTGVFNLEDGTIEPCYPCDDNLQLNWPPPIWFTPKSLPCGRQRTQT